MTEQYIFCGNIVLKSAPHIAHFLWYTTVSFFVLVIDFLPGRQYRYRHSALQYFERLSFAKKTLPQVRHTFSMPLEPLGSVFISFCGVLGSTLLSFCFLILGFVFCVFIVCCTFSFFVRHDCILYHQAFV